MDSINLTLLQSVVPGTDLLGEVPMYLTDVTEHNSEERGKSVTGKLGRFSVSINEERLWLGNGSLAKWYLGNNLQMMNRSDIEKSIEKMSDMLHLPMGNADVKSFDYAMNFDMTYPPEVYFAYMGANGRYKRFENAGGLYYQLSGRTLAFYDKIREFKSHKEPIPRQYQGRYLLRYEKRYRGVAKYFKQDRVIAGMLYDPAFYQRIKDNWHQDYLNIKKIKRTTIDFDKVRSVKDFHTQGDLMLIQSYGGQTGILEQIDEARKTRRLNKGQLHDLRSLVNSACSNKMFTCESDLTEELNKKMVEAMHCFN